MLPTNVGGKEAENGLYYKGMLLEIRIHISRQPSLRQGLCISLSYNLGLASWTKVSRREASLLSP